MGNRFRAVILAIAAAAVVGCVEEVGQPVVFDQKLESTTFENFLLTPVILYRDDAILDTIPPSTLRVYPLDRIGRVTHAFQILPPIDLRGDPAGISPYVDLGIQYRIESRYPISYTSIPGETIFTPRISNLSPWAIRLYVNYREADEFVTNYVIPANSNTSLTHAPYYYWHGNSNVVLDLIDRPESYLITREDTSAAGEPLLVLDNRGSFYGTGATEPIILR